MITGKVIGNEARIEVKVRGPRGRERAIEAVIDTGFTTSLTLPPALIAPLGPRWHSLQRGILADGSTCLLDVYEAQVLWDRRWRRILVNEADATPLVGMALLTGYELKVQVRRAGKVTIKRLA